jgi:AraC family transcriptional regulator
LPQLERITIIPSLQASDPLQHHIAMVLQTAVAAKGRAEQLYAETLADALMAHFLRRYSASQPVRQPRQGGLISYKLRRTLAYIQTHLAQTLPLGTLAEVAHMSPTHFAHLFKQATGLAPHRYIILCRIEHAKWLLRKTDMPLIDIGPEVGFSDQSHFTALFRKHVSMTPKTYRDATAQG